MLPSLLFRCYLALLAAMLLGSCQRATYSFQVEARYEALVPASDVITISDANVFALPANLQTAAAVAANPIRHRQPRHCGQVATRYVALRLPRLLPVSGRAAVTSPQSFDSTKAVAQPGADLVPGRQRSRAIAIVLAVLSISYLPLSLHNFYLGYYGRGAAAIALLLVGTYLLVLGSLGIVFGPTSLSIIGYLGIGLLAGWFFWQLTDLFRICRGELRPKDGDYRHRTSQPASATGASGH